MNAKNSLKIASLFTIAFLGNGPLWAEEAKTTIQPVTLHDASGKPVVVPDLKEKTAVVVVFLSFDCPVSTSYSQPLAELAKTYGPRGVGFVGVACDDSSAAETVKHAEEFKIPFPVVKDERLAAADALKADMTPEAFVIDSQGVVRYRGRIDNSYAARLKKNTRTTSHDLQQALDELLAGKSISTPVTQAVGCAISRDVKRVADGKVSYYRDVLPILQNSCQTCHRPGEVGPFSLMTYKQAKSWASDLKDYTQTHKMPPWKPTAGPAFSNERKMSDKDIATLVAWVDGGMAEGNPKDAPPAKQFVEGWQLGKPDLILTPPAEMQLGPTGNDVFRVYVMPTDLPEDVYITAIEVRPGNPRVVHHTLNFIDATGGARKLQEKEEKREKKESEVDRGPGYSVSMGIGIRPTGGLGGWAPGQVPRYLPAGTGYKLPKKADVVLQVHYHRDGKLEKDRTSIGLYFAKKPVEKLFEGMVVAGLVPSLAKPLAGRPFNKTGNMLAATEIPAGKDRVPVEGGIELLDDCTLYNVMPHMHLLGREVQVTLIPPGEKALTLAAIKDWDYNWQETYWLKEPMHLKKGTRIYVDAVYDNSESNPNNPSSPPKRIIYGEQTTSEMCFIFLGAVYDDGPRLRRFPPPFRPLMEDESRHKKAVSQK